MKQFIYATYRQQVIGYTPMGNVALGGKYDPSYYLNGQYADYLEAGYTKIIDGEECIPSDRYTSTIGQTKRLTKFLLAEYDDTVINTKEFLENIKSVCSQFQIRIMEREQAIQWLSGNTDLTREEIDQIITE
jgi:ABC-type sugar transport system ATPase subunit